MNLVLTRRTLTAKSTIGTLADQNGKMLCFTLEDCWRPDGLKVPGATAIPEGTYEIVVNQSERFKCLMPLLLNVPGFEGIRIHTGNTDADTHGCILVGMVKQTDQILNSRVAFDGVFRLIRTAIDAGEKVFIQITDAWKGNDTIPEPFASVKEV